MPKTSDAQNPLTVFDLTMAVKSQLQDRFRRLWVSGEISGITRPRSGHCYLTLKDDRAQINAIIWRGTAERLKFDIKNGQEVLCLGSLDVYAQRGTYQLIIERIEPQGVGSLELAFRQLHAKLQNEGLFDPAHKQSLPRFPKKIAVVTSPTGAAIRDFLQVLIRRWRGLEIIIVPSKVQGPDAAKQIANGIDACQRFADQPDVVVITRGGGSKEDLWPFNEEVVCRAIHRSRIPVISAVGHEIDVSLSDLVADVRALTPSEAAERLVPNQTDILDSLKSTQRSLNQALILKHKNAKSELDALALRPVILQPLQRIQRLESELDQYETRLKNSIQNQTSQATQALRELAARLESLNPASVLARGYSLTTSDNDQLIQTTDQLNVGDTIKTRLASGVVISQVEKLTPLSD